MENASGIWLSGFPLDILISISFFVITTKKGLLSHNQRAIRLHNPILRQKLRIEQI